MFRDAVLRSYDLEGRGCQGEPRRVLIPLWLESANMAGEGFSRAREVWMEDVGDNLVETPMFSREELFEEQNSCTRWQKMLESPLCARAPIPAPRLPSMALYDRALDCDDEALAQLHARDASVNEARLDMLTF